MAAAPDTDARTDLRIELRDRSTWLFYLVLPLVITAVLGSAMGGSGGGGTGVALVVADADHSAVSTQLVAALRSSEVFVTERLGGTLRRLLVTPTPRLAIVMSKVSAATCWASSRWRS